MKKIIALVGISGIGFKYFYYAYIYSKNMYYEKNNFK